MGKAIKAINSPTYAFMNKGVIKKTTKIHRKLDMINNYLRTLSNNFGEIQTKENYKRKRKVDNTDDGETPEFKKQKFCKKERSQLKSYGMECTQKATSDTTFGRKLTHLEPEVGMKDLFYMDEAKSSSEVNFHTDWMFHLYDEISLEGLDGITPEALWTRLRNLFSYPLLLEGKKEMIWNLCKYISQLDYYILNKPRGKLIVYDRNHFLCPNTGIVLEPLVTNEIYPYSMVNADGVRGSCSTYHSRDKYTTEMKGLSLLEASNMFGNRLVLVANQKMRENAIINEIANPCLELVDNEYSLLERLGRSRKHGETTQGRVSILNIFKDSRSVFHIRKTLEKKKLLKKQFFVIRNLNASQNKTGKLLHLRRFYRKQKSKTLLLIEEVVELLRQKPGYSLEFGEFKKYFPRKTGVHKVMKMAEFNKYIRTDIFRPYRYLYPNATAAEWKYKNREKEKVLRIFQLIDPTANVLATWDAAESEHNSDEECNDDETGGVKLVGTDFLKEIFLAVFNSGKEGVTLQELEKKVDFDYYTVRMAVRKLQAKNVIDSLRSEQGKQRHISYFARCFYSDVPRTLPNSTPMKIPPQILQKIIQPQENVTSTRVIPDPDLSFIWNNSVVRFSTNVPPFQCDALIRHSRPPLVEISMLENLWKFIVFSKTKLELGLTYEPIAVKYFETTKRRGRRRWNFAKCDDMIISYSWEDYVVKLVFLKHMDGQDALSVLEMVGGNESENASQITDLGLMADPRRLICQKAHSYSRDHLLGPNPTIVYQETTPAENVNVTIVLSTTPKKYIYEYSSYVTFDKNVTPLSVFRTNTILDMVNQSHILCDLHKMQRCMVAEMESSVSSRSQGKIDRNTLDRLLLKLSNEGYLKIFKVMMSNDEKIKTHWLITHPRIVINNQLMQTTIEQLLMRFFIVTEHKNPKHTTLSPSLTEMRPVGTSSLSAFKVNKSFGTTLGYQPKFVRIQLLHELLFYLLYDYKPLEKMSHYDIEDVLAHCTKEEVGELSPIYRKGIDWRMFIPPLPQYKEWPKGWVLFCDVLLATPLSLWVKLFHVSLEYPPLLTYMEHPVKRHFLVKDVSAEFRQVLMFKRKFLYSAVQSLYRLCFIGLAQLGPQNPNVKDHIFVYLNKRTKLLDTTSSAASYHKITPKKYRELVFSFESKEDVDDYWCQLWTISMKTPLGQRTVMEGKSVTIENPAYKESLLESLTAKTPTEAVLCDNGDVPGDHLGAAGLDSSMWAHVKKNWLLSSKTVKNKLAKKDDENIRSANIACIKPVSIKFKELVNQNRKIYLPNESLKAQDQEPVVEPRSNRTTTLHFQRKFEAKKILARQKRDLDPKDKMIRKRNGALFRAIWTSKEDRVLYLLKAAMIFLSLNSVKELVPLYVVRDLLHLISPESRNKTTNAIASRLSKLTKVDPVMKRIKEKPTELINFGLISEYFSPIIFEMNKSSKFQYATSELVVAYIHLMFLMMKHSEEINEILRGNRVSLDYFAPNNIHIFSPILVASDKDKSEYSNPVTVDAVKKDVIRSVLLSYLNGAKVGQNASYQLFCIYKKFSDTAIRSVVKSMKEEQTISLVKKMKSRNSPITTMPFVLSVSYTHMQKSTFSNITVHAIYQNYLDTVGELGKFSEDYPSEAVFVYGRLIARNEIASILPNIDYAFKIPESAYILNPYIQDRSFLTAKLAPLYQKYLKQKLEEKEKTKHATRETIHNTPNVPVKPIIINNDKQFERIRSRVTNLLMTLPCFCNRTIHENFTKFVETQDETEFTDCLSIFLKVLISITMNLLNTQKNPVVLCKTYMQNFCRNNVIDTVPKQLETQIFKICYVIRLFLKNHEFTDIKTCFEREDADAGNHRCEEILRVWLEKSKIVQKSGAEWKFAKPVYDHNAHRTFFRKNKRKSASVSTNPFDDHVENSERIPEIPEIVKEMMMPPEITERSVPHVSQLACFLSSFNFPELNEDEKVLEELRSHFIAQYPILEKFIVDQEELKSLPVFRKLFNSGKKLCLEDKIDRKFRIGPPTHGFMTESILKMGGQAADLRLAEDIITYVFNKGELGATGQQLKVYANQRARTLDLVDIINLLIEHYIILRVGISEILFVHYDFKNWLVETFRLLPHENHLLEMYKKEQMKNLKEKIETKMKSTRRVNVLLMPWVRIDGTLNVPLLDKWLTIVLSYCLDYPLCPLPRLCEKFFLVKPVELFFLLETLQDLGCLQILVTVKPTVNIFSYREQDVISRVATCLDSFKDMYVKVHNLSTLCMGFYLDRESLEFA